MPDPITLTTFTALTALAEVPANNDVLGLDDTSATATKSITAAFLRRPAYSLVVATGNLALNVQHYVELSGASAIALTITGAPVAGDVIEIYRVGTGGVTHTVVLGSGIDWDGSGNGTANFADDGDYLRAIAISATRWRVLPMTTGVTFSA